MFPGSGSNFDIMHGASRGYKAVNPVSIASQNRYPPFATNENNYGSPSAVGVSYIYVSRLNASVVRNE